jgi:hypothetical protein
LDSFTGPYAIGAGDMLRRNGYNRTPAIDLGLFRRIVANDE